jgi:NADH-quinone oxidoreductase subunit N
VEAGIKYMIVGALSSALLLFGISYLYGLTGTTDILQLRLHLSALHITKQSIGLILIAGTISILAGIGFKLALPPFHQWAPDVYEGSPTPIAAFLSVGSKAAGLVAFAKIMIMGLFAFWDPVMRPNDWGILAGVLAASAMIWGNVAAIRQTNIKRMLAYSSIAQAGYIMIGMLALNELGLAAVAFYTFAYMFANMGAFAAVAVIEDQTGSCEISTYSGLAKTSPFFASAMAVFLLSLIGIPPLAGFFAKYYVFAAAIKLAGHGGEYSWLYWLVGIGLATSVIALYYYANVIRTSWFAKEASSFKVQFTPPALAVIIIGLVGVFVFGLYPEPIVKFAMEIPYAFGFVPH